MQTQQHEPYAGAQTSSRIPAFLSRILRDAITQFVPDRTDVAHLGDVCPRAGACPFEEALAPFRGAIREVLQAWSYRMAPVAQQIETEIVASIARVSGPVLLAEFEARRGPEYAIAANLFNRIEAPEREQYRLFVRDLWGGGWFSIFDRYPVLERLIALTISRKSDESVEFAERLELDHEEICRQFGLEGGRLARLRSGLSDPHHGMRTVKIVEFESGERVVYKPKNLGLQNAWSALCKWTGIDLASTRVLDRPRYGWMEYVRSESCADESAVRRFYYRAGALVCLLYAIRGTDCHFENLVASGSYPVLVDTETLMQPEFEIAGQLLSPALPDFAARYLAASVTQSGMLPSWESMGADRSLDAGGLGVGPSSNMTKPGWRYMNTDYMGRGDVASGAPRANLPRIADSAVAPAEYVDDVVHGFEDAYSVLTNRRNELLEWTGPLAGFRHCPVRFVLRNTRAYHALLDRAASPRNLESEENFRRSFNIGLPDLPAWAFAKNSDRIWKAGGQALMELDIPLFTADANGHTLLTPDGSEIDGAMRRSGWEAATQQIKAMNPDDMARQSRLIRLAFRSMSAHESSPQPSATRSRACDIGPGTFAAEAQRIADYLLDTAIRDNSGELGWIALNYVPLLDRYTIAPLGQGLWGGAAGIALFLAAVYRLTGGAAYRDACLRALVRTRAAFPIDAVARQHGPGAGCGLGGIVYGLVRAGQFLGEGALVEDAARIAACVDASLVRESPAFDVMDGCAGALLGLLVLEEAVPESCASERAELCASRLIAEQVPQETGGAAWPGRARIPATGFAHGAAGIAYALDRWQRSAGSRAAQEAITSALRYERAHFRPVEDNWFDPRSLNVKGLPSCGRSWCSGAPGIGLARAGMSGSERNPELADEVRAAMRFVEQNEAQTHHLCCGETGWIDLLLTTGRREFACRRAAAILAQARAEGGYRLLSGIPDDSANPSLFVGLAGIGYQMLRVADPGLFPSVTLFQ